MLDVANKPVMETVDAWLADFEAAMGEAGFSVPAGYRVEFGGEQAERNRAVAYLLGSISSAIMDEKLTATSSIFQAPIPR